MRLSKVVKEEIVGLIVFALTGGAALNAQCDRDVILEQYRRDFVETATGRQDVGWTGDTETCTAGTVAPLARTYALTRVNYFRDMAGLGPVDYDSTLSAKAQEAALMMQSERSLSHYPGAEWGCFTETGREAAGKSNLAYGTSGANAVQAYMQDAGVGNERVGHRRWILYSRGKTMGQGFTRNADAMWVIGNHGPSTLEREYIAWPPAGIVPNRVVYPRWSFGVPGANFANATVSVRDARGAPVEVLQHPVANGFADNTLVWEIERQVYSTAQADVSFTVTVADVMQDGQLRDYTYTVTVADPAQERDCGAALRWSDNDCACVPDATSSLERFADDGDITGAVTVRLYTLAGQLVAVREATWPIDKPAATDVSALPAAVYVAHVRSRETGREERFKVARL